MTRKRWMRWFRVSEMRRRDDEKEGGVNVVADKVRGSRTEAPAAARIESFRTYC